MRDRIRSEAGATAIMMAFSLFLLLGASAIAVDIAAIWLDRSADQKVTDSAAAAGALEAITTDGPTACETALNYVAVNSKEISFIDTTGCATAFPSTCTPGNPPYPVDVGRYRITVTYPVSDPDPLMTSGLIGGSAQSLHPDDGTECERVGVEMTSTRKSLFAQVLGLSEGTTTVHTVATAFIDFDSESPINLLVLDRHDCNAIRAEGQGGIIVDAVFDPDAGGPGVPGLLQGVLAADSDGTHGCGSEGVVHLQGSDSMIRADGPEGCPEQSFPSPFGGTGTVSGFTKGHGCGKIESLAPGPPGCNLPSCSRTGGNQDYRPSPFPSRITRAKTRAPVDYRYNCKADYTSIPFDISWATWPLTTSNEQDIPPCENAPAPYIDDLIDDVGETGTPTGFTDWAPTRSCSPGDIDVTGDFYINCSNFQVSGAGTVVRIRGDVVFQRDVTIESSATLEIINTAGDPGFAFLRDGLFRKAGQSNVGIYETFVYASKNARISLQGGSGSLNWVAPHGGDFEDLALWSDFVTPEGTVCSTTPANCYNWSGQSTLQMEGVFFMPFATADYSGGSDQNQTAAQWIADKLVARGNGILTVAPDEGRQVFFPTAPQTDLIR